MIYVVIPMIVSELTPQPQRATPMAGHERSYVILGFLLLAGGIIGLLFIRPEADRKRLAARAIALPGLRPVRA